MFGLVRAGEGEAEKECGVGGWGKGDGLVSKGTGNGFGRTKDDIGETSWEICEGRLG